MNHVLINVAQAFASAVEIKDFYNKGHTARVSQYALAIGAQLPVCLDKQVNPDFMRLLHLTALLHDIGKIGVRDSILNKEGTLNEDEWIEIKKHPQIGAEILFPIKELREVGRDIKHHHERVDGKGYPDGLKAENIPLGSRIVAVADAFEAMTSVRAYRDKISKEEAIKELKCCSGTQFDKIIVKGFLQADKKGNIKVRSTK